MKLILAGGGDAHDSKPLDELLISLIPAGKKLLYIPVALKSGDFEGCRTWFEATLSTLNFSNYEMWTDFNNKSYADLQEFGGMYIGGGNTYSLLNDLRTTGFEKVLMQFIKSSRPVYGGSAGAIIFGSTIETAADENTVDLTNTAGLDLINCHAIQCHYSEDQDKRILKFVSERKFPVIALSERSALYVTNDSITVTGLEQAYLFSRQVNLNILLKKRFHLFKRWNLFSASISVICEKTGNDKW